MRALIFLNGEFSCPESKSGFDLTLACDGAYDRTGTFPVDLFVGDSDSVTRAVNVPKLALPTEKDLTDGEAAVLEAVARGATEIVFFGALGGDRFDHILTNLFLLKVCKREGARGVIVTDNAELRLIDGLYRRSSEKIATVSLVPIFGSAHIKVAEGLKYPIRNLSLNGDCSIGVSNEPISDEFRIEVDSGEVLVVLIFAAVRESV